MFRLKNIITVAVLGVVGWFGLHTYNYFFDTTLPQTSIVGIANKGHYSADINCAISANKSGIISVWLDDEPIVNKFDISSPDYKYSFSIATCTIANGQHVLRTEIVDSSFHKNKSSTEHTFVIDNIPLKAVFVEPEPKHKVLQGRTLHVQFQVNKAIKDAKVKVFADTYDCFSDIKDSLMYECFVPIPCEQKPLEQVITAEITDNIGNVISLDNSFQVAACAFKKQVIHIGKNKIEKEEELGLTAKRLEEDLERVAKQSPDEKLWHGSFCTPIDIVRTTCDFGTVRTTQHKGRYAHKALDIINTPRSVVWATQSGVIALKDRYANSGNTVVIDHGQGVVSMFFHLDDFAGIDVGQKIAQGNPIGTIGKTGHATGYHLHWEMRLNNMPVDPMQWTKPTF